MLFSIMTVSVYIPTNSARRFPFPFSLWRLSSEELMLLNCGVGEDSWESHGLQGDPTTQSQRKSTLNIHWKDWCWSWNSNTLATWGKEPTQWKRLMLGKFEGRRRRGQQKMRWLDSITNSMDMSFCKLQTIVKDWEARPAAVHWIAKCGTSLNDWTTTVSKSVLSMFSSKSFRVYGLTFRSLIHFEFIFVYGVIFVYRLPW